VPVNAVSFRTDMRPYHSGTRRPVKQTEYKKLCAPQLHSGLRDVRTASLNNPKDGVACADDGRPLTDARPGCGNRMRTAV
jgi:hypothetical protein